MKFLSHIFTITFKIWVFPLFFSLNLPCEKLFTINYRQNEKNSCMIRVENLKLGHTQEKKRLLIRLWVNYVRPAAFDKCLGSVPGRRKPKWLNFVRISNLNFIKPIYDINHFIVMKMCALKLLLEHVWSNTNKIKCFIYWMNALKAETDLILFWCAVERQLCLLIIFPMAPGECKPSNIPAYTRLIISILMKLQYLI